MTKAGNSQIMRTITLLITIFSLSLPAYAQYSGGTGEPNDPYQISTAEDLMLLGENPEDYDKDFILTADIDLDPNLPGRKVFDMAIIAPDTNDTEGDFQGTPFIGIFDGNGHIISHLTIEGRVFLGLFGHLESGAIVSNLGLEAVNINGSGGVGGLVGISQGKITACHSTGTVTVTSTGYFGGVGGLVGQNWGSITASYSTGMIIGSGRVGGLVGRNAGSITTSYSTSTVSGDWVVGGLVGDNDESSIAMSYSTGAVSGDSSIGGLVGSNDNGSINSSFWDIETSGQATSASGTGLTTAEMQDITTYINASWDFVDEALNGTCDYWQISHNEYPHLVYHNGNRPVMPQGWGTAEQPYLIRDARDLGTVWFKPMSHYRLEASVDLSGITWSVAVVPWFEGTFDGNGHVISYLHIEGSRYMGLFGQLGSGAKVSNLGLEIVDVNGTDDYIGGLVGENRGRINTSYITGTVIGNYCVGGLVGSNSIDGSITESYSASTVSGNDNVGGLVGEQYYSTIVMSYSTGTVSGEDFVGGLVGRNSYDGGITGSYSTGSVTGETIVGGLVGINLDSIATSYSTGLVTGEAIVGGLVGQNGGSITTSYSTDTITGNINVGGLVGLGHLDVGWAITYGITTTSFWDTEISGQLSSAGGVALTTVEMMDPNMLGLNGFANDPNWILDAGKDYPRLAWEGTTGQIISEPTIDWMQGHGTTENPYRIDTPDQLFKLGKASILWDKHFFLSADINLDPNLPNVGVFPQAVIPSFMGVFDGNDHAILNLTIIGENHLGLFGGLTSRAKVKNLGIVDVNITGLGSIVGGLGGYNGGNLSNCYSIGTFTGTDCVGGLVGSNGGTLTGCYSSGTIHGRLKIGGLVGDNYSGNISNCYSNGSVIGTRTVGGLVGENMRRLPRGYAYGTIITSYSTGYVNGDQNVGGLVGTGWWRDTQSFSFYDTQTSTQSTSAEGIGKTTAEMQIASIFLEAGWDFVDETENGTEDIWWILDGQDYPRLSWEAHD